jgi:hypothetical protein
MKTTEERLKIAVELLRRLSLTPYDNIGQWMVRGATDALESIAQPDATGSKILDASSEFTSSSEAAREFWLVQLNKNEPFEIWEKPPKRLTKAFEIIKVREVLETPQEHVPEFPEQAAMEAAEVEGYHN